MSVDLNVKLSGAISVERLLDAVSVALSQTLRLENCDPVRIIAEQMTGGIRSAPTTRTISNDEAPLLLIGVDREPERVQLVVIPDSVAGYQIFISVGRTRSDLEFALAAAVAVALGRMLSTEIRDYALFFVPEEQTSWEGFLVKTRVSRPYRDYRTASAEFGRHLGK